MTVTAQIVRHRQIENGMVDHIDAEDIDGNASQLT